MSRWSEVTRWRWHVAVITFLNKHHNFCQNFWRINCPNICIDIELKHPTPSVPLPARWFNVQWRDWQQKTFLSFRQHRNLNNPNICLQCDCQRQQIATNLIVTLSFGLPSPSSWNSLKKCEYFISLDSSCRKPHAVLQQNRLELICLIIPLFLFRPT